jgi:hypothetical protein
MAQHTVQLRITGDFVEEISPPLEPVGSGEDITWLVEGAGGRQIEIAFLGPFVEPFPRPGGLSGTVAALQPGIFNYKVLADGTKLTWIPPTKNFGIVPISSGPPTGGTSQATGSATS